MFQLILQFDENGTAKITDFGFSRTFTGIIGIDIEQNGTC